MLVDVVNDLEIPRADYLNWAEISIAMIITFAS